MSTKIPTTIVWGANREKFRGLLVSPRRILERNRTASSQGNAQTEGWASDDLQPRRSRGYCFCTPNGRCMAHVAEGTWLRQRGDMLAAIARLDPSRSLVRSPSAAARSARTQWRDRSASDSHRQPVCTRSFWVDHTGSNPTDRAKNGCKRHVLVDAQGIPLVVDTTPANVHDSMPAMAMLDRIPRIKSKKGGARFRPEILQADCAYGTPRNIQGAKDRAVTPLIARTGIPKKDQKHGSGLGRFRYVVERTMIWFGHNRRLKICYEKTGSHFQAFHDLAAGLICARRLAPRGF